MRSPAKSRRLRSSRVTGLSALTALAALVMLPAVAADAATTETARRKMTGFYEMPFPCGQEWSGKTRSDHSPSSKAIDWNRPDDDGDDVVASSAGAVTVANKTGRTGYGRYVQITHLSGETTLYAHLSHVAVDVGEAVDQGELIGRVGSTGNSTGPHLHYEQRSANIVRAAIFGGQKFVYGSTSTSRNCVDVPLAAHMLGTPAAELVVFGRDKKATFQIQQPGAAPVVVPFGRTTDDPLLGDWDGDGAANVAVRRPAESTFYLSTPGGTVVVPYGIPSDKPVAGDWDANGVTDLGVRRASTATFYLRGPAGTSEVVLGDANDLPVTGDWNGDGATDLGVYDQATATFLLRFVGSNGVVWTASVGFGNAGDLPVVGDWDGNGVTDLGVWRPSTGTFHSRRAPSPKVAARAVTEVRFGRPRG